jgi:hypothetical protein
MYARRRALLYIGGYEALCGLERFNARMATVVELKFFARAWLYNSLQPNPAQGA